MTQILHFVTCEYPPQLGGVSDFSRALAERLAACGAEIHVWAPGTTTRDAEQESRGGVNVHRVCGRFQAADLRRLAALLEAFAAPRRLILHWVPHGYGARAMNWRLCRWMRERAHRNGDRIELIIHEPFVAFERNWRQWVIAVVHRLMFIWLLQGATRIWLSTPAWESRVGPWRWWAGRGDLALRWLPLAIDVPVVTDTAAVAAQREALGLAPGEVMLGHFGTFGESVVRYLTPALDRLLTAHSRLHVLLLGRGGDHYRQTLSTAWPARAASLHSPGQLDAARLSIAIQACDLFIQPYPDGITTRRTSALAILAHGRPMITTSGHLSEERLWREAGAVRLCPLTPPEALARAVEEAMNSGEDRALLAQRGRAFFEEHFRGEAYRAFFLENPPQSPR